MLLYSIKTVVSHLKGRTVSYIPHKFPFDEGFVNARRVKRLEWYVQILVKRLLNGGKLQHVQRGISIEKQIRKRDATFANTISKFDSISFAVESVKEFQEGTFGSTPDGKNVINKTLVQLKVLRVIFHNILLVMKHKSISYPKIV